MRKSKPLLPTLAPPSTMRKSKPLLPTLAPPSTMRKSKPLLPTLAPPSTMRKSKPLLPTLAPPSTKIVEVDFNQCLSQGLMSTLMVGGPRLHRAKTSWWQRMGKEKIGWSCLQLKWTSSFFVKHKLSMLMVPSKPAPAYSTRFSLSVLLRMEGSFHYVVYGSSSQVFVLKLEAGAHPPRRAFKAIKKYKNLKNTLIQTKLH